MTAVFAAGCHAGGTEEPTLQKMSPAVAQQFEGVVASRSTTKAGGKRSAASLNSDGDRAYRKGRYDDAFKGYSNSYPNFPNAHSYIMTGDAHWRGVVQFQERSSPEGACWSTPGFARALALDLEQHYNLGFALAERDQDRDMLESPLFKRARESAACLDEMARDHRALPEGACIDLPRLKRCLGKPLLVPRAQRILDGIKQGDAERTAQGKAASLSLNAAGDRHYKNARYHQALLAYLNSYPNDANAYAYLMSGDSHWRGIASAHPSQMASLAASSPSGCFIDNEYFVSDLRSDIEQHFQVGLALAAARDDKAFMATKLYRRAGEIERCFSVLADDYAAKPASACVDVTRIRACLGEPLLK